MSGNTHCGSRYARLVAAFAVSAFTLLALLTVQQKEANTVVASTVRYATTMTRYQKQNCAMRVGTRGGDSVVKIWLCRNR